MEFWGIEVKPGKPVKVTPDFETLIHISQASLGECKNKKDEVVPLHLKVGDQKFVVGTLSTENIPQIFLDLVFEKEFELSHNWAKGSIYFVGFKSPNIEDHEGGECFSDSEEDVEEAPATITSNGNAAKVVAQPKAKSAEVIKNVNPESADDDEEDDSDSEEGIDVDEDDSDEEVEEEKTPTPKKPESSKKRANEAAPKTPVSSKKAKTEEKKKGGHIATPHPAKKGGKTPTTATQSPKSGSQVSCSSCKKTFNSGNALESHNKAKHSTAK